MHLGCDSNVELLLVEVTQIFPQGRADICALRALSTQAKPVVDGLSFFVFILAGAEIQHRSPVPSAKLS